MRGVYKIRSLIKPDRLYIGSSNDIKSRWSNHRCGLRHNKHHSIKLQRHYNKYGESDLVFEVISMCEEKDLLNSEQGFIDSYNPYFNECKIAGRTTGITTWLGRHHTEEAKQKMRHPKSEEHKAKMRIPHSLEHNINMGKAHSRKVLDIKTGEIFDSIALAAISIGLLPSNLYKQLCGETINKTNLRKIKNNEILETTKLRIRKEILQYNIDGIFIKEWNLTKDASISLGISKSNICSCLRGRRKTSGGFTWKYKNNLL